MVRKKKMGRPRSVMTEERTENILRMVKLGLWPQRAAQMVGVDDGTFWCHVKRHKDFASRLAAAEAEAEASCYSRMVRHADRHWQAMAWVMERRWRDRWSKQDPAAEVTVNVGKQEAAGPVLPPEGELANYIQSLTAAAANLGILAANAQNNDKPGRT